MKTSSKHHLKQFFTPSQLARILREESPCKHGHTIVDLAAGHGDLVYPFVNSFSDYILVDIDEEACSILKKSFPKASHLLGDSTNQAFIKKIKNLNKKIDLSVCNPPFNYKISHSHSAIPDTPYFSFRSETHFILNSLHLLKKDGYLCAILPETLFTGVRNEWFTTLIKKKHTIEKIVFCEESFLNTEAKVCIAYIKNSLPSKDKKTEIKNISLNSVGYIDHQEISPKEITNTMWTSATPVVRKAILGDIAIITRGRLSAKKLHEAGQPFYHSTGLVGSINHRSKTQPSKNKILICRVGKRSAGKIVETSPYEIPTSDCIFSLDFNNKRSMELFIRAWSSKKADQWKSIFTKGVCSRYLTLEDIKNFPIA